MNSTQPFLAWTQLAFAQDQPAASTGAGAAPPSTGSGPAPAFDAGAPVQGGDARPIGGPASGGGGQPAGGGGFGGGMLWMVGAMLLIMILMTSMSGRKERKRREALLSSIKRNDRVQTLGGIIGTVVDITPTEVVLRVDEVSNTRIRFARSAVQQVLSESRGGRENGAAIEAKGKGEPASV